ncbi:GSCOCG00006563001-RA-CDS [Cotesia congregata]|nr:GSCOCG00006563001-RA-CDS [Cotesia congregata]
MIVILILTMIPFHHYDSASKTPALIKTIYPHKALLICPTRRRCSNRPSRSPPLFHSSPRSGSSDEDPPEIIIYIHYSLIVTYSTIINYFYLFWGYYIGAGN